MVGETAQFALRGKTAAEIADSVERAIRDGRLKPGDDLASVRKAAAQLRVSPATVVSGYRILRERGMITTRQRSRTTVTARPPLAVRPAVPLPDSVVDLSSGNPDPRLLPSLQEAVGSVDLPIRLYGETSVLPELRDLARVACDLAGIDRRVAVTSGGMDGLERVLLAHLKAGDQVALEDPSYVGVLDLIRSMNLVPRSMPLDDSGVLPEAAEAALAAGARAMIVTPRWQNPTGAALSAERAADLRQILARFPSVLVVQDDHAGDTLSFAQENVVNGRARWAVVRSLSKVLGPDLRVGMVAGDALTVGRIEGRQAVGYGWVSHVLQRLVAHMWSSPITAQQVARARATYDARRQSLLDALAEFDISAQGRSGYNVWIPVDAEEPVVRELLHRGWATRAGEPYRLDSGPAIRVTTSTLQPEDAGRFAADLASVLHPHQQTRLG